MILSFLQDIGAWAWWILGLILLGIEIFAPGSFFIWLGLAAIIVGTNALIIPMAWQLQLILFAVLSIILVFVGRKFFNPKAIESDQPHLNERGASLVGKTYALAEAIENGAGVIRINDSIWQVEGPDLPQGAKVVVAEALGSKLRVEPI